MLTVMRRFEEFGKGDPNIGNVPLFKVTKGTSLFFIPFSWLSFDKSKFRSVLSESEIESFFESDFYASIQDKIEPHELDALFTHSIPSDIDARIALGVVRHPQRWMDFVQYNDEIGALVYTGSKTNPVDVTLELFATSADPLPQELLDTTHAYVGYSEFLPTLTLIDDLFSEPDNLLALYREIILFPFGELNGSNKYSRFVNIWIPSTKSIIFIEKIHKDLQESGKAIDAMAWTAAMDMTAHRSDLTYENLLDAARRGQRPNDYVRMSTRQIKPFESLFSAWTNDIDEEMWEQLRDEKP